MSFSLNDNSCVCGHPRSGHIHDGKFDPRWCELNQKACDCWEYQARRVENKEIFNLEIVLER
jgi:hypothetical protein